MLTAEQFKQVLPPSLKGGVSQELMQQINQVLSDPDMYEMYRDNLLGYARVMAEGKFQIKQYIQAVKYVSHKLLGDSHLQAYIKTFPDKYQRFLDRGVASKDIASYVTAYNKSKLVTLIMEQTIVPTHILNQDLYQSALNTLAELMQNARSEKVRCDAANHLVSHLKMPEVKKVELDVTVAEDSSISALRQSTLELVKLQRQTIEAGGMTAKDIAKTKIIVDTNLLGE